MQRNEASLLRVRFLWIGAALAAAFWARELIWQAATQLFFGMLVALAALPVMKRLEKRFSPLLSSDPRSSPPSEMPFSASQPCARASHSSAAL